MKDADAINELRRNISTLEWDLKMISNKEIKERKEILLNNNRLELNRLLTLQDGGI